MIKKKNDKVFERDLHLAFILTFLCPILFNFPRLLFNLCLTRVAEMEIK